MNKNNITIVALLVLGLISVTAQAQTCSCARVPLVGAMQLASPNDGQWYVGTTYEFHDTSELVSGSSSIADETGRERTSQTLIVEASKGLSERWSLSALLSRASHEREVSDVRATSSGIGDAIVMVKYSPRTISLYSDSALSFGLGARIPIGEDEATRQGVTLAEDMQPSTGAYAGMVWAYWAKALNQSKGARLYASASYTENGENDRDYQFGHEITAAIGGAYQTQSPWGLNLELLYRTGERDRRNSVDIPNTGGKWLELIPAVQYHVTEDLAVKASARIPVSRNLNDQLQFTTKYAFRLSASYVFGGR